MIQIYKSMDDGIMNIEKTITEGCWVSLTAPNSAELEQVAQECNVDIDDLRAPLDEEERSRLMTEDDYTDRKSVV